MLKDLNALSGFYWNLSNQTTTFVFTFNIDSICPLSDFYHIYKPSDEMRFVGNEI